MNITFPPPPLSMADKLRNIPAGESRLFRWDEAQRSSIRSTITRIKRDHTVDYNYHDPARGRQDARLAAV